MLGHSLPQINTSLSSLNSTLSPASVRAQGRAQQDTKRPWSPSTTAELMITAAIFTAGLLKTSGDIHHRRFVLRTVGEMIITAGS